MKLKVGQKYRLKTLEEVKRNCTVNPPGINSEMERYFGKIVTIESQYNNENAYDAYSIKEKGYIWRGDWFEVFEVEVTKELLKGIPEYNHVLLGKFVESKETLLKARVETDDGTYLYGKKVEVNSK